MYDIAFITAVLMNRINSNSRRVFTLLLLKSRKIAFALMYIYRSSIQVRVVKSACRRSYLELVNSRAISGIILREI